MEPAVRELLESADDATHVEFDPAVDRCELLARVKLLVPELERIAGRKLRFDESVQDATHLTEVGIWSPAPKPEGRPGVGPYTPAVFAMRFSNFGCLFTSWSEHPTERLPDAVVADLIQVVSEAGFRYVPASALDEPYDGSHPAFVGESWWDRFFDYT